MTIAPPFQNANTFCIFNLIYGSAPVTFKLAWPSEIGVKKPERELHPCHSSESWHSGRKGRLKVTPSRRAEKLCCYMSHLAVPESTKGSWCLPLLLPWDCRNGISPGDGEWLRIPFHIRGPQFKGHKYLLCSTGHRKT